MGGLEVTPQAPTSPLTPCIPLRLLWLRFSRALGWRRVEQRRCLDRGPARTRMATPGSMLAGVASGAYLVYPDCFGGLIDLVEDTPAAHLVAIAIGFASEFLDVGPMGGAHISPPFFHTSPLRSSSPASNARARKRSRSLLRMRHCWPTLLPGNRPRRRLW